MSQKSTVDGFEWFKNTYKFNVDFIKNCNNGSDIGFYLKLILNIF